MAINWKKFASPTGGTENSSGMDWKKFGTPAPSVPQPTVSEVPAPTPPVEPKKDYPFGQGSFLKKARDFVSLLPSSFNILRDELATAYQETPVFGVQATYSPKSKDDLAKLQEEHKKSKLGKYTEREQAVVPSAVSSRTLGIIPNKTQQQAKKLTVKTTELDKKRTEVDDLGKYMSSIKDTDTQKYNDNVDSFNKKVEAYNKSAEKVKKEYVAFMLLPENKHPNYAMAGSAVGGLMAFGTLGKLFQPLNLSSKTSSLFSKGYQAQKGIFKGAQISRGAGSIVASVPIFATASTIHEGMEQLSDNKFDPKTLFSEAGKGVATGTLFGAGKSFATLPARVASQFINFSSWSALDRYAENGEISKDDIIPILIDGGQMALFELISGRAITKAYETNRMGAVTGELSRGHLEARNPKLSKLEISNLSATIGKANATLFYAKEGLLRARVAKESPEVIRILENQYKDSFNLNNKLNVKYNYLEGKDYIIKNNEVKVLNEETGRIQEGKQFQNFENGINYRIYEGKMYPVDIVDSTGIIPQGTGMPKIGKGVTAENKVVLPKEAESVTVAKKPVEPTKPVITPDKAATIKTALTGKTPIIPKTTGEIVAGIAKKTVIPTIEKTPVKEIEEKAKAEVALNPKDFEFGKITTEDADKFIGKTFTQSTKSLSDGNEGFVIKGERELKVISRDGNDFTVKDTKTGEEETFDASLFIGNFKGGDMKEVKKPVAPELKGKKITVEKGALSDVPVSDRKGKIIKKGEGAYDTDSKVKSTKKEFKITLENGEEINVEYDEDFGVRHFAFMTDEPNSISRTGYKSHYEMDYTLQGMTPEKYAVGLGNEFAKQELKNRPKRKKKLDKVKKQEDNKIKPKTYGKPSDNNIGSSVKKDTLPKAIQVGEKQPSDTGGAVAVDSKGVAPRKRSVSGKRIGERLGKDVGKKGQAEINKKVKELLALNKANEDYSVSEKELLAQYSGLGGLESTGAEGRGLLDEYYTPKKVVDLIWNNIKDLLPENPKIIEPAIGTGNFLKDAPKGSIIEGFEIDKTSAKIAQILYPDASITTDSFEKLFIDDRGNKKTPTAYADLVIGNPPYGEHRGIFKGLGEEPKIAKYEEYFIKRSLDIAKEGGIVAMVIPSSFLRNGSDYAKQQIAKSGILIDAYRLPNSTFDTTDIGTDVVIFRKTPLVGTDSTGRLAETERLREITNNTYFESNPEKILGIEKERKGRFGLEKYVEASKDITIGTTIDKVTYTPEENAKITEVADAQDVGESKSDIKEASDGIKTEIESGAITKPEEFEKNWEKPVNTVTKKPKAKLGAKVDKRVTIPTPKKTKGILDLGQYYKLPKEELEALTEVGPTGEATPELVKKLTEEKKAEYLNKYKNEWQNNFNYFSGDIQEKLLQLEIDFPKGGEQYDKQKKGLLASLPERYEVDRISIAPNTPFAQTKITYDGEERTLRGAFLEFLDTLPHSTFGKTSRWEIRDYVNEQSVRGGDKKRNQSVREARRVVGNKLFSQFLTEGLEPSQQKIVADKFNDQYNGYARPDYREVPLAGKLHDTFKGNPLEIKDVQLQGVGFLVNKGVGLLAHDVGVGKTMQLVIAINETIARGWSKKPLLVVPGGNVYGQWIKEIQELLPNIKINSLANLGGEFKGDLKTLEIEDGSITILSYEGLKKLGFKDETYASLTKDLQDAIGDLNPSKTARSKAKEITQVEETLGKAKKGTQTENFFEELGFDLFAMDEVHNANHIVKGAKLAEQGKATEFRGLTVRPSDLGIKTWLATQYVLKNNNGRNVYLASATPFTNNPMEYYSILSLMARSRLKKMGIENVNEFMNTFMDLTVEGEATAAGKWKERNNIRGFKNYQQFQKLLTEFIDFRDGAEAGVKRPNRVTNTTVLKPTALQTELTEEAQELFTPKFQNEGGTMKGIGEMRLIAYSPYASHYYKGALPTYKQFVENSPKIKAIVDMIVQNRSDQKTANQVIYSTIGVTHFPMIKEYLIRESGFKPAEVGIITGAVNKKLRGTIQEQFNEGKIKVLLGSDAIKEGVNLQVKTTDLYIASLPWNFTQVKQVIGRVWRQGNEWKNVRIHNVYIEDSIDVFSAQKIETKQKRYEESLKYKGDYLDVGDVNFEELKLDLIKSGVRRVEIEKEIEKKKLENAVGEAESNFGFYSRKAQEINNLKERTDRYLELTERYEKSALEDPADEYYTRQAKEYREDYNDTLAKYEEAKTEAVERGVLDIEKLDLLSNEVTKSKTELEGLEERYVEKLAEATKEEETRVATTAGKNDFKDITDKIAEQNKTFFEKAPALGTKTSVTESPTSDPVETIQQEESFNDSEGSGDSALDVERDENMAAERAKWNIKMSKEAETDSLINKTTIMQRLEKIYNIPIKSKATYKWGSVVGMFYPKKQIIRMKKWGELAVAAHEIAHHIDSTLLKLETKWRKSTRAIQKELADLDYNQKQRRTKEGFAEYMRYYLTTDLAESKAPEFTKFFEDFLTKNPELKGKIVETKQMFDTWNKQGAENRFIQHIDWKGEHTTLPGVRRKAQKAIQWIQTELNDSLYVPRKIEKEIEKIIGRKFRPTESPTAMMEFSQSKAGAIAKTFVMEKAIDEFGNVVGKSLAEVLKPIARKDIKFFVAYGVAKRVINLEGRGVESGFDMEDAEYIIEKYKDKGWDPVVEDLTTWSNNIMDWLTRAGGLSVENTLRMRELNPIYLPFKRAFLDDIMTSIKGSGGIVNTGTGIKKIKGSGRAIINPLDSMIQSVTELIGRAQKLQIAKLYANIAEQEGVGGFITEVPAPTKATTFNSSQIQSYIEEITGEVSTSELDDMLTVFTQDSKYSGKDNIVSIYKDGKQKFYEIHPDLYEALQSIEPMKLNGVMTVLSKFSGLLRLGATGLKASFGLVRNPVRDAPTYAVFSKRKGATPFDIVGGTIKGITAKEGEPTWRFKRLGGAMSGQIGYDRKSAMSTFDEVLLKSEGFKGKTLMVVKHPIDALRNIVSAGFELGPRSAELEANYKKYKKEKPDWTDEDAFVQAFNDAQDVTINFTKAGRLARKINEVSAFFNVAIRGPEKMYRSVKERPIQTIVKAIMWLTITALLSWWQNKDKQWYKNLEPAYKYNNLFYEVGDVVFRLPIPFELGTIFMSLPMAILDSTREQDLEAFSGILDILKSQIPDPTPSAFGPSLDVAANKNFLGRPIESKGSQYLYPTERKKSYTSKLAVNTSKMFDALNIELPYIGTLSPVQIDYLIDNYTGGFLRQFKTKGNSELADQPVIGDVLLRNREFPSRQLNNFFTDYTRLQQKKSAGIATTEEQIEYLKIKSMHKIYTLLNDIIRSSVESGDRAKADRIKRELTNQLKNYGYK